MECNGYVQGGYMCINMMQVRDKVNESSSVFFCINSTAKSTMPVVVSQNRHVKEGSGALGLWCTLFASGVLAGFAGSSDYASQSPVNIHPIYYSIFARSA